jgi:putative GTP pyrophosphokinase
MTEERSKPTSAAEWYAGHQSLYDEFAKKLAALIEDLLKEEGIAYHSVTGRAKTVASYRAKASLDKYDDPLSQIKDMAGIRIIAYVDSEAKAAAKYIQQHFTVIPEHSDDASGRLGVDRVGYRSLHFVCTLGPDRRELPEFRRFRDIEFELQVRTILQHAWAEIEHDRNYKFAGVLPDELKRRFMVLAGALELADREFNSISEAIDSYASEVNRKTTEGSLDVGLDTPSLRQYLLLRFGKALEAGALAPTFNRAEEAVLDELRGFGVKSLLDVDNMIPGDYEEYMIEHLHSNFLGLLRDLMIIKNPDKYFGEAWQNHWGTLEDSDLYRHYGIDIDKLVRQYGLQIED